MGFKKGITTQPAGDLNFLCGEPLSVQFGGGKERHACFCRGMSKNHYLTIQTPFAHDIESYLMPGNHAIVRYVVHGTVCGFKVKIIQHIKAPCRQIFLEYPSEVDVLNLRDSKRLGVSIPAQVTMDDQTTAGRLRDLSCGGCLFVVESETPVKSLLAYDGRQELTLAFGIDDSSKPVSIKCTIARYTKEKYRVMLGLTFDKENPEYLETVSEYVERISQIVA